MTDVEQLLTEFCEHHSDSDRSWKRLGETIESLILVRVGMMKEAAAQALVMAEVGCVVLHDKGKCKNCDAWQFVRALDPASTDALEAHDKQIIETEHNNHLAFMQELYATMVDPVFDGRIKEDPMFKHIIKAAREQRQQLHDRPQHDAEIERKARQDAVYRIREALHHGNVRETLAELSQAKGE